jgi:hypothetical protein
MGRDARGGEAVRVQLQGVQCDQCDKFEPQDERAFNDHAKPDGWFVIDRMPLVEGRDESVVCSPACIVKLGQDLVKLEPNGPKRNMKPNEEVCGVNGCMEKPKTLAGLKTHRSKAHGVNNGNPVHSLST